MNINATLIAQLIVFFILVWFTMKFVWPPVMKALDERADKIAEGLAAAERGQSDFKNAEKKAESLMVEGRGRRAEIVADAEKYATQIKDEAQVDASKEAARIRAEANAQIELEVARAKESLKEQVAILAVQGAEKILRREVNVQQHADILNALKQEL